MTAEKIMIEAIVAAHPDRAWEAYTTPEDIMRWNFASDDWCCPSAEVDLRVGGRQTARMEARDGSFGFEFGGTYKVVTPPEALTLVMDDGRVVRTTFEAVDSSTRIVTVFDAEATNPIEMQREGWQAILNSFKRFVEGSTPS